MTETRPDGGRLIVPQPVPAEQPKADPGQATTDRPGSDVDLFAVRYMKILYASRRVERVERVLVGGVLTVMIGIPLLIGYLYASGEIS